MIVVFYKTPNTQPKLLQLKKQVILNLIIINNFGGCHRSCNRQG
jgi:hypothetical protein